MPSKTQWTDEIYDRKYVGHLGRPSLRGKLCRILNTWRGRGLHNVKIEFTDGEITVCPMRCLRRATP